MKKDKNKCGSLWIAMFSTLLSIVQTKNKKVGIMQMSVASIFILLLMPMTVFADNVLASPTSTNVAWGNNVVISYRLVNTSGGCNVDSNHTANVTINTLDGVISNVSSFKFASCNKYSQIIFTPPTPMSVGNHDYNITVNVTGGKSSDAYNTTQANVTLHVNVPVLTGNVSVIITFDDGWTYNNGDSTTGHFGGADVVQPILKANNQSAVAFIIEEPVTGGWGAYMNITQIQSLYADGWDISSHSLTHGSNYCTTPTSSNCVLYLVNANDSLFKNEMGDSKDWLDSNTWTRGSMFFAYPYGSYNPSCFAPGCDGIESGGLIDKMKASGYYIGARTVDGYWRYPNPPHHPNFYVGGHGTLIMPTLSTDSNDSNIPYSVQDIIAEIDNAIQEKQNGLVILTFHQIVNGAPRTMEQFDINDFQKVSDYLKLRNVSGNVKVVTLSQYFGVPNPIPTYIPNNATLQSVTIGRTWMKISWIDGAGNITNENEVLANGQQNYYITNRSFNITGLFPGQSVTAIIDAVNTSWGKHTKNIVPLIINATMPIYTPSTPNIGSTYGGNWVLTSWSPGSGSGSGSGSGLNKTDFYNVNVIVRSTSNWVNGTTNTSINTTGLSPGQNVIVQVYALNGTVGFATMNNTPATIETTVPQTNAPVILSNTTDSANFTMNWVYKAGLNTDLIEININNGGTLESRTESLASGNIGTFGLQNLAPHVTVGFSIRGRNQTTGLYSDYVYANQTVQNNPVVLSNISGDYIVTEGNVLTLHPIATDLDHGDIISFSTTKINESTIDPNTGVFYFDTTNASLGMYNINITADDGRGSSDTKKVSILVNGIPVNTATSIFTPSVPNIRSTYGDSWVLASWSQGDGLNKTDFYNVNVVIVGSTSRWTYGTTNTSVNTTGLSPGQTVIVQVYAFNGTVGSATMNNTPAMIETTIIGTTVLETNAPVILSNTTDSANFTMNWTYKAGLNAGTIEININNGGTLESRTESLASGNIGTFGLQNLAPHVTVGFSIRGRNQTTGLYSGYIYANQTLPNNPVVLSNISSDYTITKGNVLTIYPIATDLDHGDTISFSTDTVNGTDMVNGSVIDAIDLNTGIFSFNATNVSLGMYNVSITADDGHGSSITNKVSILVKATTDPTTVVIPSSGGGGGGGGSGSSGGGGGSIGSGENYSNIANFETEDCYILTGKGCTIAFPTIQQGIYQVFLNGESQEVSVRVDNLRTHQSGTTDAPGNVLLYTDVSINSERISVFSFSFKMNKSNITNAENVKVYRWNNGTWELLDTKLMNMSDTNVYFQTKAIPARLSKFAIAELVTSTNGDENISVATKLENGNNSSTNPKGKRMPGFEILVAIGAISAVYIFGRNGRKRR